MSTTFRKIISGIVILTIGTIIAWYKGDVPPNYGTLLQMVYFSFVVGNGFEHYTSMRIAQSQINTDGDNK